MELATEIITTKQFDLYNKNNALDDLTSLDLSQKIGEMSHIEYKKYIDTNKCINIMSSFADQYFNISNTEKVSRGLLYAYYISGYSTDIFFWCETNFDMKLIHYANNVVSCIESLIVQKDINTDDFTGILDYYYALYNLWSSKSLLKKIEEKSDKFIDIVETYSTIKQLDARSPDLKGYLKEIIECINDMVKIDSYLSIKTIVGHYNDFSSFPEITNHIWDIIGDSYSHDKFRTMSVLMSKLRKKLIFSTDDIKSRKNIYYSVDIDKFHTDIQNSSIKPETIIFMINTLSTEAHKQKHLETPLPECNLKSFNAGFDIYILTSLNKLYNSIY